MESECDIVRWYLSTMERGVDTKIVVKEFATLREAHDKLIEHTSTQIKDLSFENT